MRSPHRATQNRLLAALSDSELARLTPHLQPVQLAYGQILFKPSEEPTYRYFPVDSIVSLIYVLRDGSTAEIAAVANEGVIGVPLFMGGSATHSQAVVRVSGCAYRLPARIARAEFHRGRHLRQVLLHHTQALVTQIAQTAVCNRHHKLEQQLCRWLLLSLDRLRSDEISITQETIAGMLGVRREGITAAAHKLRQQGLISYHRGRIVVNDRAGLERHSCECYEVVKDEYERLLGSLGAQR